MSVPSMGLPAVLRSIFTEIVPPTVYEPLAGERDSVAAMAASGKKAKKIKTRSAPRGEKDFFIAFTDYILALLAHSRCGQT